MRIWTLLLSIYIDSKDLQSNFEVPAVFGSTYFWVSLYKLPTVVTKAFVYFTTSLSSNMTWHKRPLNAVDQLPDLISMFCLCSKWRSVKYSNQLLRTFTRSKGRLMVNSSMPGMWSTLTLIPGSVYLDVFQNSNLMYC